MGIGTSLASSTNTVPSMDGESQSGPLPSHDKVTWTPHDAAVGKSADQPLRSLLQPQQLARDLLPLDVFGQLYEWASHGVLVDCRNDWSQEAILTAIQAMPSPTALMPEVKALIKEDLQYKVKAGFTEIVPAKELLRNMPKNLKITWLAVIPQKNCHDGLVLKSLQRGLLPKLKAMMNPFGPICQ
jgi:hypothetical protein